MSVSARIRVVRCAAMEMTAAGGILLGLVVGVRHAFEAGLLALGVVAVIWPGGAA
jgi:hypothetical protein